MTQDTFIQKKYIPPIEEYTINNISIDYLTFVGITKTIGIVLNTKHSFY